MATGLVNNTTYYFKVAAINGVAAGEYSDASAGATPRPAPVVTVTQALAQCNLGSTLKIKGGSRLLKGPCLTNAGQAVTIKVKLKGKGKSAAKVKQTSTKIKVKAAGLPLKIVMKLSAPAVPGFTAYSGKVKYKAK